MAESGTRPDEPERFRRQGSVSSKQDLIQWENASVETCTILSWLGYGPEIIQSRRDAYREYGKLVTARFSGMETIIITGSKAEGLSSYTESDIDIMRVLTRVICLEDDVNSSAFSGEITVLRSLSRRSYHGHCRLQLERRGTTILRQVNDAFCDDGYGRELLSSDLYVNNWSNDLIEGMVRHERAGPSIPSTWLGNLHLNKVLALPYYCPSILSKWAARPRHWPPLEAVHRVVSLGAVLTPVGFKERNLMATSGLDEEQQRTWISTITDMLNEGPRVILRLPKIRQCIIAHPEPLRWYSGRRIELEMLTLMRMNRSVICMDEVDYTDAIAQALIRRENEVMTDVCAEQINIKSTPPVQPSPTPVQPTKPKQVMNPPPTQQQQSQQAKTHNQTINANNPVTPKQQKQQTPRPTQLQRHFWQPKNHESSPLHIHRKKLNLNRYRPNPIIMRHSHHRRQALAPPFPIYFRHAYGLY
ncbi:uncharacterized protein LOC127851258 [Dreissena polymorpha]|uniref:uncharacterized protein LOC127851258 n=1 Tax=Dreissena polymorpha TaxID=45954 RepID=UPI0022646671|nr:uncharacterized protein LOC127851258 [Dreissena polymorpha]